MTGLLRSSDFALVALLRVHARDALVPVGQRRTSAVAAAKRRRHVGAEGAGLADVLGRDPDVAAIDDRRAVIAPARAVGIRVVESLIAAEAVGGPEALRGDLHRPDAAGVDRGECGARIMVRPNEREGDHTLSAGWNSNRGVDDVVSLYRQVSLVGERRAVLFRRRPDDEPLDPGLELAVNFDSGVQGAPQLAIGVDHLLHAGVVAVELVLRVGRVRIGRSQEDGRAAGIVEAVTQRRAANLLD